MDYNPRGGNGTYKTEALFWETIQKKEVRDECPFTIKEEDRGSIPSMYKLYMQCVDEYDFVKKYMHGSQAHWERLCSLKWFMEGRDPVGHRGLKAWRNDMRLRDESSAKAILMQQAKEGNVTAAKALREFGQAPKKKAGRPQGATKDKPKLLQDNVANFLKDRK